MQQQYNCYWQKAYWFFATGGSFFAGYPPPLLIIKNYDILAIPLSRIKLKTASCRQLSMAVIFILYFYISVESSNRMWYNGNR